jgi:hypothetical protein
MVPSHVNLYGTIIFGDDFVHKKGHFATFCGFSLPKLSFLDSMSVHFPYYLSQECHELQQ